MSHPKKNNAERRMYPAGQELDKRTARGNDQVPDVSVDFNVESGGGGYQMDLYVDGKLEFIGCRDFGGNGGKKKIVESLIVELTQAVKRWREKN